MNKDKLIDIYLDGNGNLKRCPKCGYMSIVCNIKVVDFEGSSCLNEECDYTLEVLKGGLESE